MSKVKPTTVYFDGSCPICRKEISVYQKRAEDVAFVDVSKNDCPDLEGLSQESAMARFHVRKEDGTLVEGGAAFILLWGQTRGFKLLSKVFQLPGMMALANLGYDQFLKIRPWIHKAIKIGAKADRD